MNHRQLYAIQSGERSVQTNAARKNRVIMHCTRMNNSRALTSLGGRQCNKRAVQYVGCVTGEQHAEYCCFVCGFLTLRGFPSTTWLRLRRTKNDDEQRRNGLFLLPLFRYRHRHKRKPLAAALFTDSRVVSLNSSVFICIFLFFFLLSFSFYIYRPSFYGLWLPDINKDWLIDFLVIFGFIYVHQTYLSTCRLLGVREILRNRTTGYNLSYFTCNCFITATTTTITMWDFTVNLATRLFH